VVSIYPTGDELVDPAAPENEQERRGAIVETNSHLIGGMVTEWGGWPERARIVPDRPEAVRAAILEGVERADIVVVNAGSSAGREDFVPAMIAELGELLAHGIDVMPGKPAALGIVGDKPVLGVPGYPVSAYVICEEFLRPLVHRMQGLAVPPRESVPATMGRKTPSRLGTEEHVRVKAGRVGERLVAVPIARGASLLNSVVRADGVVRIPAPVEGVDAGEVVCLEPLRPLHEIERSLLVIGSHDITLDLLNDFLRRRHPGMSLSSAHVGSLGGLTALRRGECHVAGTHLLDEATGEYNLTYIRRLFGAEEVVLIHLAMREQGLITAPGNPLGLRSLEDVIERRARFINRQRGSGTRMLLEFELKRAGRDGQEIEGYDRELYTHLAVAAAVASDGADCALGVLAAARALHLGFVPVAREQFDLAIRADAWETPPVRALRGLLEDKEFREAVEGLGGYDLGRAGERLL
jgi:putative molybdopterin biosynthesis protein